MATNTILTDKSSQPIYHAKENIWDQLPTSVAISKTLLGACLKYKVSAPSTCSLLRKREQFRLVPASDSPTGGVMARPLHSFPRWGVALFDETIYTQLVTEEKDFRTFCETIVTLLDPVEDMVWRIQQNDHSGFEKNLSKDLLGKTADFRPFLLILFEPGQRHYKLTLSVCVGNLVPFFWTSSVRQTYQIH